MPINKIHPNCDCILGSLKNGKESPTLYTFALDESPGYRIFKEPTKVLYRTVNKSRLEYIEFFLADDSGNEVDFNGEVLSFTLHLIKK